MKEHPQKPDFDKALREHMESITNRDLKKFAENITGGSTMYTIIQNGFAFKTPEELIAVHDRWFKDPDWIWEGSVIHKVVGEDMAMALIKYDYRTKPGSEPFSTWLTYVFQLQDNRWRIIHDHNTALDFHAFERSAAQSDK